MNKVQSLHKHRMFGRTRSVTGALALLTAAVFTPRAAHAQIKENWENGVVAAKWTSSGTRNSYIVPAGPIVLRNSVVDDPGGAAAACAGKYLAETIPNSGGRVFSRGAAPVGGVQPVTPGQKYCLSAWVRAEAGAFPFVGINYTNAAGVPVTAGTPGSSTHSECWMLGNGFTNSLPNAVEEGVACNLATVPIAVDGTWRWVVGEITVPATIPAAPLPGTGTQVPANMIVKVNNFCGAAPCPLAAFDDVQLTLAVAGVCPTAPPADTAPHVPCAGTTPVCVGGDATNNAKCMDCNGNNGQAGATRPCPTTAAPSCELAGPNKGACTAPCSGDFGSGGATPCAETTPFCVGAMIKTCKPCNGNNGSGATEACPPQNPNCTNVGPKTGACGKCTSNADCGGATPRCDVGTGKCTDDCTTDSDCGNKKSAKICDAVSLKCVTGCRGDTTVGNGCPDGQKCSSTDLKPGTCSPIAPDAGPPDAGRPDTGAPDTGPGPGPGPGPQPDAGGDPDAGAPPGGDGDTGGGCSTSPTSVGGSTASLAAILGLVIGALARSRKRR